MKYSLVIWDFNGTILDDVQTGIDSVNRLLARRNIPVIADVERYYSVFGFPIKDYYSKLGFDFERESYDTVAHEWVKEYLELVKKAPARERIVETVKKIKAAGVPQVILSATEADMLKAQVKMLGISEYFDEILGMDTIYAYGKQDMALAWMKKNGIKGAVLIGDTEHDAEVAEAIGADCILVTGGHQSREKLESTGVPVKDDTELAKYLLD